MLPNLPGAVDSRPFGIAMGTLTTLAKTHFFVPIGTPAPAMDEAHKWGLSGAKQGVVRSLKS